MSSRAPASSRRLWPALVVFLIGGWVLAGALFKLLAGTPADLPAILHGGPFGLDLTYKLVIAIELASVVLAFLRPSLGWLPALGLLLVFDFVLVRQLAAGAESCGCFGPSVEISPQLMLAIDTALLAALLLARPWREVGGPRVALPLVALVAAGAAALPWLLDRQAAAPPAARPAAPPAAGEVAATPEPSRRSLPAYLVLSPEQWVGQSLFETPLATWLPEGTLESMPPDATWVFYRESCDHCAQHLETLAREDTGEQMLVLLRVPEEDPSVVVHVKPAGAHVLETSLPDGVDYVLQTPSDLEVVEYEVRAARVGLDPAAG